MSKAKNHNHNKAKLQQPVTVESQGSIQTPPAATETPTIETSHQSKFELATWNEIGKYPVVQETVEKVTHSTIFKTIHDRTLTLTSKITSSKYFQSERAQYIIQRFLTLLLKLDSLLAVILFNKGIDSFIAEWDGKRNGKVGIWILWFFIDYLANVSNHILKELIIKPLHFTSSESTPTDNLDQDDALPHLTELTSTTKNLSKDIHQRVQTDYVEPTRDNMKKQFDQFIKPKVDQAKETYKAVSTKYETKLKENDSSIPRAIYTTGLDIGNETIEKINKYTQQKSAPTTTTTESNDATTETN
ncbi:hypothetical protein MOUN0_M03158 [Monosporozyma unispora]|nr:hypothetical protein C6P44_004270 [Kazachstania unispora]